MIGMLMIKLLVPLNLALQVVPIKNSQGYYKEEAGKSLVLENYHTLYLPFNLSNIKYTLSLLHANQIVLEHIVRQKNNHLLTELFNFNVEKLNNTYDEYEKLYEKPSRKRRGLINLLGSGIKVITGNLDNEDFNNIEYQIEMLKSNQLKEIKRISELSSFAGSTTNKFEKIIRSINANSKKIQEKLSNLEETLDAELLIQNHFLQISKLSDLLKTWERTISFAHSNTLNIELFSLNEVHEIWQYIHSNYLSKKVFPIRHLTDLIALCPAGFMIYNEMAIVVIKVPIFSTDYCNLSLIYSIPNETNQLLLVPSHFYCNHTWYSDCEQRLSRWICKDIIPNNCTLHTRCTAATAPNNYQAYQLTEKKNLLICTKQEKVIYENCQQLLQEKVQGCNLLLSPCELIIDGRKFHPENIWLKTEQFNSNLSVISSGLHVNFKTLHLAQPEDVKDDSFQPLNLEPISTTMHTTSHALLWIIIICIGISILIAWRKRKTFLTVKKLQNIVNEDVSV